MTLILLGCFKDALDKHNHYGQLDAIWRLQIGLALVPAAALLYFRLTMPEGRKFLQSSELSSVADSSLASSATSLGAAVNEKAPAAAIKSTGSVSSEEERRISVVEAVATPPPKNVRMKVFVTYFSEWRHLKVLLGTASTWFLLDIAFYGLNLNQTFLLQQINYASGKTMYDTLLKGAIGNLIIAAAGYVPGYFFTIGFIEVLGRRPIQIGGFLLTSLMFGILAGAWNHLDVASKFALFTLAQLFFNFGPNATTFIIPGEVFPSRVRGFAHGFSAASGKLGAILAGVLFNYLAQQEIGIPNVLWIFFGCNILGAILTVLLVPETRGVDYDEIDYRECQEKLVART